MSPIGFLPKVVQSRVIQSNSANIVSAKFISSSSVFYPSESEFSLYFSNDGGTTWESASFNTTHTFSSTGQELLLQIIANSGSELRVKNTTTGADNVLRIEYT